MRVREVVVEHDDHPDVLFEDDFGRRANEIQRTPTAAGAVASIPSKQGPWTGNNQLGIEREFEPDENNRQTILRLDEWGFPEHWTVCLGLEYDAEAYGSSGALTGPFALVAEIEFGCGGVTQYVEIDYANGAAITLPMNALNVVASFSVVPTEGGDPSLPDDLRLRASVVRGNISRCNPTRSFRIDGTDEQVEIPPFARRVRIVPEGQVIDPFTFYSSLDDVDFEATASGVVMTRHMRSQFVSYIDVINQLVGAPVFVDIPEGARFMRVDNLGESCQVQFEIAV